MADGLTLAELFERTGCDGRAVDRRALQEVLSDEVDRGRVVVQDGLYRLREDALPDDVAAALRGLGRPDTAALVNGHRRPQPSGGRLSPNERRNLAYVVH